MCDPNPPTWTGFYSTCVRGDNNSTFFLTPCADAQKHQTYCPPLYEGNMLSNCTWPNLEYPMLYPNEQGCQMSAGCVMGTTCLNNVCVGNNFTQPCNSNFQCSPGLRCVDESFCEIQLNVNDTGCFSDTDCINTCGCNRNPYGSYPGTCLPYFSIKNNNPVYACNQYNSLLCESGQCVPGTDLSPATCVEAFQSPDPSPMECSKVEMCYSTNNNVTVFSDCVCGINPDAKSYCQPFLGDLAGQDVLSNLKLWVTSEAISGCNTERRFDWMCQKDWATGKADKLYLAQAYYNLFPMLPGNDECAQAIYTNKYYEALQAVHVDYAGCLLLGGFLLF